MTGERQRLTRRQWLLAAGGGSLGVSGCLGGGGSTPTATETPSATPTPTDTPVPDAVVADLGSEPSFDGLDAFVEDGGNYQTVTKAGEEAWATDKAGGTGYRNRDGKFIYFNVSDSFINDTEAAVSVTVRYFDESEGSFTIGYDARGGTSVAYTERQGDIVRRTDSGAWKEHTFRLNDAKFANRMDGDFEGGADFRLGIGGLSGDHPDIAISQVTVRSVPKRKTRLRVRGNALGNVFRTDEEPTFVITTVGDTIEWTVTDHTGATVTENDASLPGQRNKLPLSVTTPGYYELAVTVTDGEKRVGTRTASFGIVDASYESVDDPTFGVGTRVGIGGSPEVFPLLEYAGAGSVRDTMRWSQVEPKEQTFTFERQQDVMLRKANQHGLEPLLVGAYNNRLYVGKRGWDGVTTLPFNERQRTGFATYIEALFQRYPDLTTVEVWHEPNAKATSTGESGTDPEAYTELLRVTNAIATRQRDDPTVVGGSTAGIPMDWLRSVFDAGGADYMDALSVHPDLLREKPQALTGRLRELKRLLRDRGVDLPVWLTQIGWSTFTEDLNGDGSPEAVTNERTQARYLVQASVRALAESIDRVYWHDFSDATAKRTRDGSYGLVRHPTSDRGAYAPKPAYLAYATLTRQLASSQFIKRERGVPVTSYLFDVEDTPVRVLWGAQNRTVMAQPKRKIDIVGMTGATSRDGENVQLPTGKDPIYVRGAVDSIK
jgi:hypothetical protein